MRLLSLDQSSRVTGYAIFDGDKLIKYGTFVCGDDDLGERLVQLKVQILGLIKKYEIEEVVFEDIIYDEKKGVQTFKILAEVFGVVYEVLSEIKMPCAAMASSSWRNKLSIKGAQRNIQKKNAQEYVLDKLKVNVTEDEADAICIGAAYLKKNAEDVETFDWS